MEEYEKRVIDAIFDTLEKMDPERLEKKSYFTKCEHCGDDGFLYFPEFDYGMCQECSHEKNVDKYMEEMQRRKELHDDIRDALMEALDINE